MTDDIAAIAKGLSKAAKADLRGRKWYLASCDACGWFGSSQDCGTDSGGDDSDVYCPKCHASGCDCGRIAEKFGDAIVTHLTKEPSL